MTKLSEEQFEKANSFIKSKGRKLECVRFELEFQKGSRENALKQLFRYQNEDGGFGNG